MPLQDGGKSEELKKKYEKEITKYSEQQKDLRAEAENRQRETQKVARHANRFDLGEVFLEAALVITSLTLLTGKRGFWMFGSLLAVAGLAVAASAWALQ